MLKTFAIEKAIEAKAMCPCTFNLIYISFVFKTEEVCTYRTADRHDSQLKSSVPVILPSAGRRTHRAHRCVGLPEGLMLDTCCY